ncbi:hypothetical protein MMC10_006804 [Thelotrema lepadinum]|nr:hypothetical protein [Thelotrema lepadinum]
MTMDGDYHQRSRAIVRPTFAKSKVSDFELIEKLSDLFLAQLPTDGSTIDLQPLFLSLSLDASTQLLFGESMNLLGSNSKEGAEAFVEAFDYAIKGLGKRIRLRKLRFLHRDPKWFSSVSHVHRWVDGYIDNAFTCLANEKSQSQDLSAPGNKSLLREMARNFPSREELRSQITAVFMPARETIGFAMGNVFHAIARHPDVYQKLREEILEHAPPEQPLIYDTLKSLRYTQAVVNESELLSFFCSLA